jgi:hypothetical protein
MVKSLSAGTACPRGGPPMLPVSITRSTGPSGSMVVLSATLAPGGRVGVLSVGPEKPDTMAKPGARMVGGSSDCACA